MKKNSPKGTKVFIYDSGTAKFIHTKLGNKEVLSISTPYGAASIADCVLGIKEIMHLNLVDVLISVRPTGVTVITEKPDHIPSVAK